MTPRYAAIVIALSTDNILKLDETMHYIRNESSFHFHNLYLVTSLKQHLLYSNWMISRGYSPANLFMLNDVNKLQEIITSLASDHSLYLILDGPRVSNTNATEASISSTVESTGYEKMDNKKSKKYESVTFDDTNLPIQLLKFCAVLSSLYTNTRLLDLQLISALCTLTPTIVPSPRVISNRCFARVGLMGNPSDGFGGKTVSFLISNFSAAVHITESSTPPSTDAVNGNHSSILPPLHSVQILPHPNHDLSVFESIDHLHNHSHIQGYYGGIRLIQATCKKFSELCSGVANLTHVWRYQQKRNIVISYETNIPRMVGLSGSSAIVTASMRALMQYYNVTLNCLGITEAEFPQILLDVEKVELGISAGLQDRVVQAMGGLVHMDFSHMATHAPAKLSTQLVGSSSARNNGPGTSEWVSNHHGEEPVVKPNTLTGVYTRMPISLLPPLYLAYNTAAGGDSGQVHSTVKERWAKRDPDLVVGMSALGSLADAARDALLAHEPSKLGELMTQNFELRRKMYGDGVVGLTNIRAVEVGRMCGLSCKFTGSGGALVCIRTDEPDWLEGSEEEHAKAAFAELHFELVRVSPACQ